MERQLAQTAMVEDKNKAVSEVVSAESEKKMGTTDVAVGR